MQIMVYQVICFDQIKYSFDYNARFDLRIDWSVQYETCKCMCGFYFNKRLSVARRWIVEYVQYDVDGAFVRQLHLSQLIIHVGYIHA